MNSTKSKHTTQKCSTMLEAFGDVLEASKKSALKKDLYRKESRGRYALDYLNKRMGLTDCQSILLSIILEESMEGSVSILDLSKHLDCTRLEVLRHSSDLDTLKGMGLIYTDGWNNYWVERDAVEAFVNNQNYENEMCKFETDDELFLELNRLHSMAHDHEINSHELNRKLKGLLEANKSLPMACAFTGYMNQLDEAEFRFLVAASLCWLVYDNTVTPEECRFLFDNASMGRLLSNNLCKGSSKLNTLGLIECVEKNGLALKNEYCLTVKAKRSISEEWTRVKDEAMAGANLMSASKIVKKSLFYNENEQGVIADLQSLLFESNLKHIMRRLKERNLRGGFTCLFYGAPGTGKTETVYQLARKTGRDIIAVDFSQIRSKWVGESEKNVKAVFDDYRSLCKNSRKKPILLLNEADAIICKRMSGAERSVDKSENTIQNIILQEMESLDGILIATTNLTENMDKAFERRFLYKVEFCKPDTEVRAKIWRSMLPQLKEAESIRLAEKFSGFAGGQIENTTRKVLIEEALHGGKASVEDIMDLCLREMFDDGNERKIGFLS